MRTVVYEFNAAQSVKELEKRGSLLSDVAQNLTQNLLDIDIKMCKGE